MDEQPNKYGVLPSVWDTLTRAERVPHYNRFHRTKNKKRRKFTKAQKQARRDRAKRWREENPERDRTRKQEYRDKHRDKVRAWCRAQYWKNHKKSLQRSRDQRAKVRSVRTIKLSPDEVFKLIDKAVSRTIPKFVRDDVIAEMCLAVLEGKLFIENIGKEASKFLAAHNRAFDHFKTISVDTEISEGVTILDTLTVDSLPFA